MKKHPTAFLVHGYIGSGKTTTARELADQHRAIRFTHDEWMRTLYGADPPEDGFADYSRRVAALIETNWTRCLSLNVNVVLDFGFWRRAERDRVRALVTSLGGTPVLVQLSCPEDVAWARVQARNAACAQDSLHIARNTFDALRSRFEPLDPDEDAIAHTVSPS